MSFDTTGTSLEDLPAGKPVVLDTAPPETLASDDGMAADDDETPGVAA